MKRFIVKTEQLKAYIEKQKTINTVDSIKETLLDNKKYLNENVSLKNHNQSVIDNLVRKNLLTEQIREMLVNEKIIDNNNQIL